MGSVPGLVTPEGWKAINETSFSSNLSALKALLHIVHCNNDGDVNLSIGRALMDGNQVALNGMRTMSANCLQDKWSPACNQRSHN